MIVCRQCSHNNPDGTSWCQNCNAFLEFEGETQPGQSGHTEQLPAATARPPAGPVPSGSAGEPSGPPPANPGPPTVATPANRGESLVARPTRPGDAPPPPDPSTAARHPGEPAPGVADSTQRLPPATGPASDIPPIRPGEIVCPVCGWGNEPTRRFCRHDGAVLVAGGAPRGQAQPLKAGQRQRRTGGSRRGPLIVVALLVPVLVAAAVFGVIFLWPAGEDSNKAKGKASPSPAPSASAAGKPVQVPATGIKIQRFSSQSGAKVASNLLDGKPETYWSTAFPSLIPNNPKPDIDRRPRLDFVFEPAITLTRVDIINGASGADFAQRSRVQRVILQFADGGRQVFDLQDKAGEFQPIVIKTPRKISSLVIHVSTSYMDGATGNNRYRFSLAEVRFFAKE